jgi:hypothetical protein
VLLDRLAEQQAEHHRRKEGNGDVDREAARPRLAAESGERLLQALPDR